MADQNFVLSSIPDHSSMPPSSLVISEHSHNNISSISSSMSSTSSSPVTSTTATSLSSANNPIGCPTGLTNAAKQHYNNCEKAAINQIATLY